jgi:hypothetical protein
MKFSAVLSFVLFVGISACPASSQEMPAAPPTVPQALGSAPQLVEASLTTPVSTPFHLKATIAESGGSDTAEVELLWVNPNKWRRTIQSPGFSQTVIANGSEIFETDSSDYFPLSLRVLVEAMVNPQTILNLWRPGDPAFTKANGLSQESGAVCLTPNAKRCFQYPSGLAEFVGATGHSIWFTDYRKFKGQRVARQLIYRIDAGDAFTAKITKLDELKNPSPAVFSIDTPTPKRDQIQTADLTQAELQASALQPLEIIWPQVLDGETSGDTSYYVSIDRSGQVREILPASVAVERADDSARRQIMKWKFRPILRDGVPVQADSLLNFHFDTRAYGPAEPLTDSEVRKLAKKIVEPLFPAGATSGASCSYRVAVDSEGYLIEAIANGCARDLSIPALKALQSWTFSPIIQDGQPRPYRGEVTFRAP